MPRNDFTVSFGVRDLDTFIGEIVQGTKLADEHIARMTRSIQTSAENLKSSLDLIGKQSKVLGRAARAASQAVGRTAQTGQGGEDLGGAAFREARRQDEPPAGGRFEDLANFASLINKSSKRFESAINHLERLMPEGGGRMDSDAIVAELRSLSRALVGMLKGGIRVSGGEVSVRDISAAAHAEGISQQEASRIASESTSGTEASKKLTKAKQEEAAASTQQAEATRVAIEREQLLTELRSRQATIAGRVAIEQKRLQEAEAAGAQPMGPKREQARERLQGLERESRELSQAIADLSGDKEKEADRTKRVAENVKEATRELVKLEKELDELAREARATLKEISATGIDVSRAEVSQRPGMAMGGTAAGRDQPGGVRAGHRGTRRGDRPQAIAAPPETAERIERSHRILNEVNERRAREAEATAARILRDDPTIGLNELEAALAKLPKRARSAVLRLVEQIDKDLMASFAELDITGGRRGVGAELRTMERQSREALPSRGRGPDPQALKSLANVQQLDAGLRELLQGMVRMKVPDLEAVKRLTKLLPQEMEGTAKALEFALRDWVKAFRTAVKEQRSTGQVSRANIEAQEAALTKVLMEYERLGSVVIERGVVQPMKEQLAELRGLAEGAPRGTKLGKAQSALQLAQDLKEQMAKGTIDQQSTLARQFRETFKEASFFPRQGPVGEVEVTKKLVNRALRDTEQRVLAQFRKRVLKMFAGIDPSELRGEGIRGPQDILRLLESGKVATAQADLGPRARVTPGVGAAREDTAFQAARLARMEGEQRSDLVLRNLERSIRDLVECCKAMREVMKAGPRGTGPGGGARGRARTPIEREIAQRQKELAALPEGARRAMAAGDPRAFVQAMTRAGRTIEQAISLAAEKFAAGPLSAEQRARRRAASAELAPAELSARGVAGATQRRIQETMRALREMRVLEREALRPTPKGIAAAGRLQELGGGPERAKLEEKLARDQQKLNAQTKRIADIVAQRTKLTNIELENQQRAARLQGTGLAGLRGRREFIRGDKKREAEFQERIARQREQRQARRRELPAEVRGTLESTEAAARALRERSQAADAAGVAQSRLNKADHQGDALARSLAASTRDAGASYRALGKDVQALIRRFNQLRAKGVEGPELQRAGIAAVQAAQAQFRAAKVPAGTSSAQLAKLMGLDAAQFKALASAAGSRTGAELMQGMSKGVRQAAPTVRAQISQLLFGGGGLFQGIARSTGTFIKRNISATLVFGTQAAAREAARQALEAEQTFVRITSALEATERSSRGVQSSLQGISTSLGVQLESVFSSMANLVGVFEEESDVVFATEVVHQLELISQGALSAKEGYKALSSVAGAFEDDFRQAGLSVAESMQRVGDVATVIQDQLSVNIEDTIEGVGQMSELAAQMKLSFEETAVFTGVIAKGTAQAGTAAAEQFGRILGALQTPRAEQALVDLGIATEGQFRAGEFGEIITGLVSGWDSLTEAQQRSIGTVLGGQRQQRALQALLGQSDRVLRTLAATTDAEGAAQERANKIMGTFLGLIRRTGAQLRALVQNLLRSGIFNAVGLLLAGFERVLGLVNEVFTRLNDLVDLGGPLGTLVRTVFSLALAWKATGLAIRVMLNSITPMLTLPLLLKFPRLASFAAAATGKAGTTAAAGAAAGAAGTAGASAAGAVGAQTGLRAFGAKLSGLASRVGFVTLGVGALATAAIFAGKSLFDMVAQSNETMRARNDELDAILLTTEARKRMVQEEFDALPGFIQDKMRPQLEAQGLIEPKIEVPEEAYRGIGGFFARALRQSTSFALDQLGAEGIAQNVIAPVSGVSIPVEFEPQLHRLTQEVFDRLRSGRVSPEAMDEADAAIRELLSDFVENLPDLSDAEAVALKEAVNNLRDVALSKSEGIRAGLLGIAGLGDFMVSEIEPFNQVASLLGNLDSRTLRDFGGALSEITMALGVGEDLAGVVEGLQGMSKLQRSKRLIQVQQGFVLRLQRELKDVAGDPDKEKEVAGQMSAALQELTRLRQETLDIAASEAAAMANFFGLTGSFGLQAAALTQQQGAVRAQLSEAQALGDQQRVYELQAELAQLTEDQARAQRQELINELERQAAETRDPFREAQIALERAVLDLEIAERGGLAESIQSAQVALVEAQQQVADVMHDIASAEQALAIAMTEDPVRQAQLQLQQATGNLRRAHEMGLGRAAELEAEREIIEAQRAIRDTQEAIVDAQLAFAVAMERDSVRAAALEVQAARVRLERAARQGGAASIQARQELELAMRAQQDAINEIVASRAQLAIAIAQAGGFTVDAAQAELAEAQRQLDLARAQGRGEAELNSLQAGVISAEASLRDTILQERLATIDFQLEMGEITANAAMAAIQQILDTMDLTEQQRRDLLLRLKNMKEEISSQLSQGFNIPGEIRLPTPYEVRRSLGLDPIRDAISDALNVLRGGFRGGLTPSLMDSRQSISHVQNEINITVASDAQVEAVARRVAELIGRETGQSFRSNTSTPKLVRV